MGVHKLWNLLDPFGEVTQPEHWRGKRVAIDASIWIAQFRARCPTGENIEQRILEGILLRVLKLLFYGIEPVFVFDRVATSSKWEEQRRRAERRDALDRAALRKRAREIVTAQMAADVLDVHTLRHRSPLRLESQIVQCLGRTTSEASINDTDDESGELSKNINDKEDASNEEEEEEETKKEKELTLPSELRGLMSKRRRLPVTPEAFSVAATNAFLVGAEEYIEDRKRGMRCLEANALQLFSSSLFMGPRHVVDESVTVCTKYTDPNDDEDVVICSAPKGRTSDYEVNSDDSYSSSLVIEGMHTADKCSVDSVIIVDRASDSLTGHLHEIEYEDRSDVEESSSNPDLDAEGTDNRGELTDDSASIGGHKSTDSSQGYSHLWNPSTQLTRQTGTQHGPRYKEIDTNKEHDAHIPVKQRIEEREVVNPVVPALPVMSTGTARHISSKPQVIPFELLEIVELLDCCGIPYVLSPHEADAQCAFLNQNGLVDAVFTEDSDVIVHGAPIVLRGFFAKRRQVVAYRQSDLITCGIDKNVLVTLALLLGCDYAEGAAGLSLLGALEAVAAVWRQEDGEGTTRVLAMLRRWQATIAGDQHKRWEEDGSTLAQFLLSQANREKWATVVLPLDFPRVQAVEAFFDAPVDTDVSPFAKASPDWQRLQAFVAVHGLLANAMCRQHIDLVQRERLAQRTDLRDQHQRRLLDFGVQSRIDERYVYKKQPLKFAAALSFLRSVK